MAFRLTMVSDVRDVLRGTGNIADGLDEVADALDDVASESTDAGRSLGRSLDSAADSADDLAGAARDAGRDVERALGDAEDSASDLARTGREAGDDLGRGISDGAEEATDATTRMERSFSESVRAMRDDSSSVGDGLGDGISDGADRVSEGTEQMRDDAVSNATEMAAGFDGSVGSMTDAAQGFIAEGLAGFGPAGAAAGLAAGIGIGLITSGMEKAKEQAQETADEVAGLADEMIELRSTDTGPEHIRDALRAAATEAEDGKIKIRDWAEEAQRAGVDFADFAAGMAGDSEAAQRSMDALGTQMAANSKEIVRLRTVEGSRADATQQSLADENQQLQDTMDSLSDASGIVQEGTEVYGLYTEALGSSVAAQLDAAEAAEEATTAAQDQQDAAEELVTATEAVTQAVRDQATAALEASNAQIGYAAAVDETTTTIAENGATLDISTEKGRENHTALNDLAAQTLSLAEANRVNGAATDESNASIEAGRQAFLDAATAAGATAEEAQNLANKYGLIPETVDTAAQVTGVAQAEADLAAVTSARQIGISPYASVYEFQRAVDSAVAGVRRPTMSIAARWGEAAF